MVLIVAFCFFVLILVSKGHLVVVMVILIVVL